MGPISEAGIDGIGVDNFHSAVSEIDVEHPVTSLTMNDDLNALNKTKDNLLIAALSVERVLTDPFRVHLQKFLAPIDN